MSLAPYAVLGYVIAGLFACLLGVVLVCFGVGAWGKRKAEREGRECPDCGLWAEPVEIELHRMLEHERE